MWEIRAVLKLLFWPQRILLCQKCYIFIRSKVNIYKTREDIKRITYYNYEQVVKNVSLQHLLMMHMVKKNLHVFSSVVSVFIAVFAFPNI